LSNEWETRFTLGCDLTGGRFNDPDRCLAYGWVLILRAARDESGAERPLPVTATFQPVKSIPGRCW
jgi:hypothetical protein